MGSSPRLQGSLAVTSDNRFDYPNVVTPLNIRISLPITILYLVLGAVFLSIAIFGDRPIYFFAGPIFLILGCLVRFIPTVQISRHEVKVKTPIGITTGTYPVRFPGDLAFVDGKLWHVPTNSKIVSLKFGYDKNDLAKLQAQLTGTAGAPPTQAGQQGWQSPAGQPQQPVAEHQDFYQQVSYPTHGAYQGQGTYPQQASYQQPPAPHGYSPYQPSPQQAPQSGWQASGTGLWSEHSPQNDNRYMPPQGQ